jgi:hypothetical protein
MQRAVSADPKAKVFPTGVLLNAGNTLTQRLMTPAGGVVTAKLDVSGLQDGQTAGLALFSKEYGVLGVRQQKGQKQLVYLTNDAVREGFVLNQSSIWLRAMIDDKAQSTFAYSLDGQKFIPFGEAYLMKWTWYRGLRLALFSYNELSEAGYVDVDSFDYTFPGPPPFPKAQN